MPICERCSIYWHCVLCMYVRLCPHLALASQVHLQRVCVCAFGLALELRYKDIMN